MGRAAKQKFERGGSKSKISSKEDNKNSFFLRCACPPLKTNRVIEAGQHDPDLVEKQLFKKNLCLKLMIMALMIVTQK